MRYLKTYESFDDNRPSNQTKLIDDVEDIFLDLSDNGFEVDLSIMNYTPPMLDDSLKSLVVDLVPLQMEFFRWSDIKDVIDRLEEYCFRKDQGYGIDVEVDGDYMHIDRFIDVYGREELNRIHLYIYSEDDYGDLLNQKDMNESLNNSEYSIYDFTNDLNIWNKNPLSFNDLKTWTNHFVGDGFYEKLDDYITRVWDSMKKVDYDTINDRFLELWDDVNVDTNWILPCIAYGDYYRAGEANKGSSRDMYNGSMPIRDLNDDDRKKSIMIEIVRSIIQPTLTIGYSSNNVYVRNTNDEIYVTDKKYQCENFEFSNFNYFSGFDGDKLLWKKDAKDNKYDSGKEEDSITKIFPYDWKKYELYSPENVMNMYVPCIYINIGENGKQLGMILSELESRLDDIVDTILPEIDCKEVIWDMSRGTRRFSSHRDAHEYNLKILLNF